MQSFPTDFFLKRVVVLARKLKKQERYTKSSFVLEMEKKNEVLHFSILVRKFKEQYMRSNFSSPLVLLENKCIPRIKAAFCLFPEALTSG